MRVPLVFVLAGDLPVVMEAAETCVWFAKKGVCDKSGNSWAGATSADFRMGATISRLADFRFCRRRDYLRVGD